MAYRNAQVFVQSKTARLLRIATKLYPQKADSALSSDVMRSTDELADGLLQGAIAEKYPLAAKLAEEQDRLEKEFFQKAKDGQ